ncbi:putative membrane protein [Senna tora]|uniref:Putative membrane protein n=1 Tax=Senna tora TaxID=362788 RepID=A0A834TXX3_9FABA|nr:putative membrane protein [Senna tora]
MMDFPATLNGLMKATYVIFAFCSAFVCGAIKGLVVGPIAALIVILGNVGIILGLFPAHVAWTVYTLLKINIFDAAMKVAILFALPALFGLWLGLGIAGSFLVGVGYGFFTPWVSTFEAFRQDNESKKFLHSFVDGTWGTIKGSCTVVRDFADMCYHSYPSYLKELRESPSSNECQRLRLIHIPGCMMVGLMGLVVEIPLFTAIAIVKSPYMLFKGWFRLIQDLIGREGPFLETACIPIAGLTILMWPLAVVASILMAIFSSFFIGLYASVIVFQERSFRRGVAYVIAMVAEFDEYTNDWLYLREGTIFPKPQYRKKRVSHSSEFSVGGSKLNAPADPPAMFMPSLAHSRTIWDDMMKSCEMRGKELLDARVLTDADLYEWLKGKNSDEAGIVGVGLPSFSFFQSLLFAIKANSNGLLLLDGIEITYFNRPKDKILDWFFNPIMVLKEQIRVIKLEEAEIRYLEKLVLFGSNTQRLEAWDNGGASVLQDPLRLAQIQGLSRRLIGMTRSISKFPTYRRRFRQIVKALICHSVGNDVSLRSCMTMAGVRENGKSNATAKDERQGFAIAWTIPSEAHFRHETPKMSVGPKTKTSPSRAANSIVYIYNP